MFVSQGLPICKVLIVNFLLYNPFFAHNIIFVDEYNVCLCAFISVNLLR